MKNAVAYAATAHTLPDTSFGIRPLDQLLGQA
ncbi:hypothetical protein H206_00975 [Candidatus Electrothrix aarhusensis]|uniref:Uncharacterized protein n=1 Tax=Candidatus Electrothrix aarhusensis TaxID=1859131 RepID=A0A444IWU3_9BACT|nr:hypothetical protein H206_00975 [Candidatus Electrothrix aarhusensis]